MATYAGGAGVDTITGSSANDTVIGGAGNGIYAGRGDTATGGDDRDRFTWSGPFCPERDTGAEACRKPAKEAVVATIGGNH